MISLFVALTLTPMLAARMAPPTERTHGSVYHRLERGFSRLARARLRRVLLGWTLVPSGPLTLSIAVGLPRREPVGVRVPATWTPSSSRRPTIRGECWSGSSCPRARASEASHEFLMSMKAHFHAPAAGALGPLRGRRCSAEPDGPGTPNQGLMFAILKPRAERASAAAQELIRDTRAFLADDPGPETRACSTCR